MIISNSLITQRLLGVGADTSVGAASSVVASPATSPASVASPSSAGDVGGRDFSSMMASLITDATQAVQTGERAAVAQMRGEGSIQHTVEAIMRAEQSLQAAIAIRDKAVAAYQELSRMAI